MLLLYSEERAAVKIFTRFLPTVNQINFLLLQNMGTISRMRVLTIYLLNVEKYTIHEAAQHGWQSVSPVILLSCIVGVACTNKINQFHFFPICTLLLKNDLQFKVLPCHYHDILLDLKIEFLKNKTIFNIFQIHAT